MTRTPRASCCERAAHTWYRGNFDDEPALAVVDTPADMDWALTVVDANANASEFATRETGQVTIVKIDIATGDERGRIESTTRRRGSSASAIGRCLLMNGEV